MFKEKLKKFFSKKDQRKKTRGQSLVEFALTLPILLMLLSGLVEFGFMLNDYLAIVDASREAARKASNWDHTEEIDGVTFFEAATGLVINALEPQDSTDTTRKVAIRGNRVSCTVEDQAKGVCDNEIIVSVYGIDNTTATLVESHHWVDADPRQTSRIDAAEINARLSGETKTYAGAVVVEVFYNYEQILGLPWLAMIPDPVLLYGYTIMPLASAEPEA